MGLTFSSTTNFVIIMVSGTISIFILFYQIFKSIIEDWLKKTNEEKKQLKWDWLMDFVGQFFLL